MDCKYIFYTADWCKWCQLAKPFVCDVFKDYGNFEIFECNDESQKQEARNRGIKELPTIAYLKDGVEVSRTTDLETREQLNQWLAKLD